MAVFFQIISFLVANRAEIKKLILDIQGLIPDAPGAEKAAAVRHFIGATLNISDQIENVWPMVAPIFNLFVSDTKAGK